MSYSQFQEEETPIPPQRLSAEEARAVIGLWQQRRDSEGGQVDLPSIPDVAEGLDISVEDAARLLGEVRARQAQKQQQRQADDQQTLLLEKIQRAEERRQLAELRRERAEWQRQQAEQERQSAEEHRQWHRPRPQRRTQYMGAVEDSKHLIEAQGEENNFPATAIEEPLEDGAQPVWLEWEDQDRPVAIQMLTGPYSVPLLSQEHQSLIIGVEQVLTETNRQTTRRFFWGFAFLMGTAALLIFLLCH